MISLFEREGKRASRKGRVQGEDEVSTQNMPKFNIKLYAETYRRYRGPYCGPSLSEQRNTHPATSGLHRPWQGLPITMTPWSRRANPEQQCLPDQPKIKKTKTTAKSQRCPGEDTMELFFCLSAEIRRSTPHFSSCRRKNG